MSARSKARKRALDLIYSAEMRGRTAAEEIADHAGTREAEPNPYTIELVHGVEEHRARIDELISTYAQGWTLERMPAVDRNVLRLGIYELLYVDDIPDAVAVSEALNLVRDLSTDESPAFVNGVLGNILRDKPQLAG